VGVKGMKMNQAYVDLETGKVACCWDAANRQQVVDLFKRAGVVFESISLVREIVEKDVV
jgi:hypothetical protein